MDQRLAQLIERSIREAGHAALAFYGGVYTITEKSRNNPVTEADFASEKILLEALGGVDGYGLLSEESWKVQHPGSFERLFIIDPLDGTKDFIDETGDFSVMIGVLEKGVLVGGFVYQPTTDILYSALRGQGAWKLYQNKREQLHVDAAYDFTKQKILVSRFHLGKTEAGVRDILGIGDYAPMGSAGLKLATLAEGRAHIYVAATSKMGEWDVAAGALILQEAGGCITDLEGNTLQFGKKTPFMEKGMIASNGVRHKELVQAVQAIINHQSQNASHSEQ